MTPRPAGSALIDRRLIDRRLRAIVRGAGHLLFFSMLLVPTAYRGVKAVLLGVVVISVLVPALIRRRIALHPQTVVLGAFFVTIGLASVWRGAFVAAPGALQMATVYVLWPMLYLVLVAGASDRTTLAALVRTLIVACYAISAYSLVYVLWSAGHWPSWLYVQLDPEQAIGFYDGFVEFNLPAIASLLFLVPFTTGALLASSGDDRLRVSRPVLWGALALGFLAVLLTGRRALLVVVGIAPVVALGLRAVQPLALRRQSRRVVVRTVAGALSIGAGLFVYLGALYGISLTTIGRMVASGFQFGSDPVAMSRARQFGALVQGWMASPLLGSGHGMPAPDVIRSLDMPWAYELSYVALLYHTGLVGVVAYAAGVLWIALTGVRLLRSGDPLAPGFLAVLVGSISFLIANATNPYLEKYDYLWVIFLPVAFVNAWLIRQPGPAGRSGPDLMRHAQPAAPCPRASSRSDDAAAVPPSA